MMVLLADALLRSIFVILTSLDLDHASACLATLLENLPKADRTKVFIELNFQHHLIAIAFFKPLRQP